MKDINIIMNFSLVAGVIIYWLVSRIYIARELRSTKKMKDKYRSTDAPWSKQAISFLKNLNLGKAFSLATVGTITLFFFGIFCGTILCTPAAILELAIQSVLRILYISILFILYLILFLIIEWRDKLLYQVKYESMRMFQVFWEFFGMFAVIIREITWWFFPTIPYLRFPGLIRFDRYPYSADRKEIKPLLQSAWFSYDLWKSLPFFNERPYPDSDE